MDKSRHLEQKINKLLKVFPVVAILGPRQCGKSTLVKKIRKSWKYYDLENINDYQLIAGDPVGFFERNSRAIILDEAQQYPELFKVLRGVIDSDRNRKGRFILTGSGSPEIVKGLTESLAGRIGTELWPFRNSEFFEKPLSFFFETVISGEQDTRAFDRLKPLTSLSKTFDSWLYGGYPEPAIMRLKDRGAYNFWMENYFNDFISRDIRRLFPRLNIIISSYFFCCCLLITPDTRST